MRRRSAILMVLVAVVMVCPGTLAWAHHKNSHDGGKPPDHAASRDRETRVTENNDSDGIRDDVVDNGDNRHPSGRDRSVEPGRSGEAGGSLSDPDDDGRGPDRSNGGPDKPGGSGGVDKADQDWNNGCGNDDDFEDDNEGLCGGRKKKAVAPAAAPARAPADIGVLFAGASVPVEGDSDTLAVGLAVPVADSSTSNATSNSNGSHNSHNSHQANNLHNSHQSGSSHNSHHSHNSQLLPLTGASISGLLLVGLSLLGLGSMLLAASKRRRLVATAS